MPKITELDPAYNITGDDLLLIVNDPDGSPSSLKITAENFFSNIPVDAAFANNLTVNTVVFADGTTMNTSPSSSTLPTTGQQEGYVVTWDSPSNSAIWQAFPAIHDYHLHTIGNTYVVESHVEIVLADPNSVSDNIRVILNDANTSIGKSVTVKNINPGSGYIVTVTTQSGMDYGSNYIEDPDTGQFVTSVDIPYKGDLLEWIYDGSVFRHLKSHQSLPSFYYEADTFAQLTVQNRSSGTAASGDIVVYNDAGDPKAGTGPFIDFGINSSTYNDTTYGDIWTPNAGYVYNQGGDLIFAAQTGDASIVFAAGNTNTTDVKLTIDSIGTTFYNSGYVLGDIKSVGMGWMGITNSNTGNPITIVGTNVNELECVNMTFWSGTNDGNSGYVSINTLDNTNQLANQWNFFEDGATQFPYNPSSARTSSGDFLKFRLSGAQKIIGTDNGDVDYPNVDRIVISGGDGYGTGEGGDIYLWAGRSGANGGSGGDIKVDAGNSYANSEGGTIKIRGGNSDGGTGGFVELWTGTGATGAPITLSAWNGGGWNQWVFQPHGNLVLPSGGDIKNYDGYSVIKSIPQNEQSAAADYTLVLSDAGKHIYKNDGAGYSVVVPMNADVDFEIGTAITIVSGNSWTYIYPFDNMTTEIWGAGFNDVNLNWYIPQNSMATLLKIGTDKWMLSGAGLGNDV